MNPIRILRLAVYGVVFVFLLAGTGWLLFRGRVLKIARRDLPLD